MFETCLKKVYFVAVLGFAVIAAIIPINARSTQQFIGWSSSEYDAISNARSRAEEMSESMINSCLGRHVKSEGKAGNISFDAHLQDLKREIDYRFNMDQDARLMDAMTGDDSRAYARIALRRVDADNLAFERQVYSRYGFLGSKDIGTQSAQHFLVLVIHADRDRALQLAVLKDIDKLPSSDSDKSLFAGEEFFLKHRELYKPGAAKNASEIAIPYKAPPVFSHGPVSQCIENATGRWYLWYVQNSLNKGLLEKARARPSQISSEPQS